MYMYVALRIEECRGKRKWRYSCIPRNGWWSFPCINRHDKHRQSEVAPKKWNSSRYYSPLGRLIHWRFHLRGVSRGKHKFQNKVRRLKFFCLERPRARKSIQSRTLLWNSCRLLKCRILFDERKDSFPLIPPWHSSEHFLLLAANQAYKSLAGRVNGNILRK